MARFALRASLVVALMLAAGEMAMLWATRSASSASRASAPPNIVVAMWARLDPDSPVSVDRAMPVSSLVRALRCDGPSRAKCLRGAGSGAIHWASTFLMHGTTTRGVGRPLLHLAFEARLAQTWSPGEIVGFLLESIELPHGLGRASRASEVLFGVKAEELSADEAKLLACFAASRERCDPLCDFDRALERSGARPEGVRSAGDVAAWRARRCGVR